MEALNVYKNQPIKSFVTILIIIMGLATILWYQELEVKTISAFFEIITSDSDKTELYLTWFLNLASFASFAMMGVSWIKDSFKQKYNYYESDSVLDTVIGFTTGIILIACSLFFAFFLFNNLLGLVVVVVVIFLFFSSGNDNNRKYRR